MRKYKNLPNPQKQVREFNRYLLDNNKIIKNTKYWVLLKNKFIKNQLVIFAKIDVKYLVDIEHKHFESLKEILKPYKKHRVYINSDKEKSVVNRLHIHIQT